MMDCYILLNFDVFYTLYLELLLLAIGYFICNIRNLLFNYHFLNVTQFVTPNSIPIEKLKTYFCMLVSIDFYIWPLINIFNLMHS